MLLEILIVSCHCSCLRSTDKRFDRKSVGEQLNMNARKNRRYVGSKRKKPSALSVILVCVFLIIVPQTFFCS